MLNYHNAKQDKVEAQTQVLITYMEKFDEMVEEKPFYEDALIQFDLLVDKAEDHIEDDRQALEYESLLLEIEEFYQTIPDEELTKEEKSLKKKIVFTIEKMNKEIDYVITSRAYFPFMAPFFQF